MTEWRKCPSWPEYDVSDDGRIRRTIKRRAAEPRERTPFLANGYPYIVMRHDRNKRCVAVHRLVAEAFIGPAPTAKHQVAHTDGDRLNNRASNLRYATRSENERDKIAHGKSNRGERCARAKLDAGTVSAIRAALADGYEQADIASRFGTTQQNVSNIKHGRSWAWLS